MDSFFDKFNSPKEQCKHWVDKSCWNPKVTMGIEGENKCPFPIDTRCICQGFERYPK